MPERMNEWMWAERMAKLSTNGIPPVRSTLTHTHTNHTHTHTHTHTRIHSDPQV